MLICLTGFVKAWENMCVSEIRRPLIACVSAGDWMEVDYFSIVGALPLIKHILDNTMFCMLAHYLSKKSWLDFFLWSVQSKGNIYAYNMLKFWTFLQVNMLISVMLIKNPLVPLVIYSSFMFAILLLASFRTMFQFIL